MTVKSKYSVEQLDNKRANKTVANLWTNLKNWPLDRIDWFYQNNGYGKPITWLIKNDELSEPLGFASVFNRRFSINGKSIHGGVNCDFLIHPMHRTFGPAVLLIRKLVSEYENFGIKFLMAYPNSPSLPAFLRCGYKKIGSISRWTKVLVSRQYLQNSEDKKLKILSKISPCIDVILKLASYETWNTKAKNISLNKSCVKTCKESFEQSSVYNYNIGERSQEYVKWRYLIPQTNSYEFSTIYDKEGICGYLCYTIDNGIFYIEDLFLTRKVPMLDILSAIVKLARYNKVSSINIGLSEGKIYENELGKMGFKKREYRSVLIHTNDGSLFDEIKDANNWYLMEGDVDL